MGEGFLATLAWWMLGAAVALYAWVAVSRQVGATGSAWRSLGFAAFLVGFAGLLLVIDPVDARRATVDSVLTAWRSRLPIFAAGAAGGGLASSLLGAVGAWRWGLRFAWPTGALAVFALVGYRWVAGMVPPEDAAGADDLLSNARPFLTLILLFPALGFLAGAGGVTLGRMIRRR